VRLGVVAPGVTGSPTSVFFEEIIKKTPLLAAEGFMILMILIQGENSPSAQSVITICLTPWGW
jgi:hypothetical protein